MKYKELSKKEAREIEIKAPSLEDAVAQVRAAVMAGKAEPMHYKIKACFYEEESEE